MIPQHFRETFSVIIRSPLPAIAASACPQSLAGAHWTFKPHPSSCDLFSMEYIDAIQSHCMEDLFIGNPVLPLDVEQSSVALLVKRV